LIGDDANNLLIGGAGADTLTGNGGNDVLRGGADADVLSGGDGVDMVQYNGSAAGVTVDLNVGVSGFQSASGGDADGDVISGFERAYGSDYADTLIGDDANNLLIGGAGADTLTGNGGNDVLRGGADADVLSGGDGADTFVFNTALSIQNIDRIVDFSAGDGDRLQLDDAYFSTLTVGALQETEFRANLTGLAEAADDRIIYNTSTGQLSYDADGLDGAEAIEFAVLMNSAALDASDIFTI
jgi:Ca2+-binding RTX toxin-like protein